MTNEYVALQEIKPDTMFLCELELSNPSVPGSIIEELKLCIATPAKPGTRNQEQ